MDRQSDGRTDPHINCEDAFEQQNSVVLYIHTEVLCFLQDLVNYEY